MKTAFLRLVGLSPGDTKQIEVFLRFTGRTADFQWIRTEGDTCDLQLEVAASDGVASPRAVSATGKPAVRGWILDDGQRAPDDAAPVLRRPLQIDVFEALLRARERQLGSMAPARAAAQAPASPPLVRAAAPDAVAEGAPFIDDVRRTYRLVRWPGSDLLRGKPKYVRMLGFLSNRPLSLARLKVLSGIDEASCRDLLGMLDQRGLLIRGELDPDSAPALFADTVPSESGATSAVATTGRVLETASAGLLSRLRKRLGIT